MLSPGPKGFPTIEAVIFEMDREIGSGFKVVVIIVVALVMSTREPLENSKKTLIQ